MTQILVVDDNQGIRRMLARKLEKLGHQVKLAERGQEALDLLQTEAVDLVLLDQMMPDMDGLTTFEKIRPGHPQLPVIMITAHSSIELAVEFIKAGGTDFVEKPVDFEVLGVKIRQALEVSETNQRLEIERQERQLAEQSLKHSEELFRQVIASVSDSIYVTEVIGDEMYVNRFISPNTETLTGYPVEKFMADWSFWGSIIYPEDREAAAIQAARLTSSEGGEMEYRLIRADGEVIWVRDSARVETGDSTRMIYGVVGDITARKQAEQSLIAAQKLADLGTLAAGVAHEINSPLQVITGLCQSVLKRLEQNRLEPDYCGHKLEVIQRNGWRCAEIVRALKTYAHASTTKLEAQDLKEIVRDTLLLTEHQLKNWSNISISTELAPALPQLICDRNQISQVLINLLSNARDAMPYGGEIVIRTGFDKQSPRLWLQVADGGIGIPEAVRERIFDPFFTTKTIGHGTGLGLSIIRGIVRAHGGEIEVESAPKQGTTFTLFFPVVSDQGVVISPLEQSGRFDENGR